MPIYESVCKRCGKRHEYFSTVADCQTTPSCCNFPTEKAIFSAPAGIPDIQPYQSPIDGRPINSRSARRDDFARHDCRPWEGMEMECKEADKRQKEIEAKQDAKLETAIHTSLNQLTPEKRKLLETSY